MKTGNQSMMRRMLAILILFVGFGFVPLIARLAQLQIFEYDFYQKKAVEQQTRDTIVTPKRGTIYDRNMKKLAVSASVETVYISPASIKNDEERNLIADGLSEILGVNRDEIYEKSLKKNYYQVIKKKIEDETATEVRKFIKENKLTSVALVEDSKRYYPYGNFASHVIGFVGTDEQGLQGVEYMYDSILKGKAGRIVTAKNAHGSDMHFQYESRVDAENGSDVVLTIDEVVQHFLEKHLETAVIENDLQNRAAGIVMDVKTGEILAMATKPDYDLNDPFTITDPEVLEAINALEGDARKSALNEALNQMWRNKAVSDLYDPGSTFKILTAAIGLEENVVHLDDHFYCSGSLVVADRRIRCWKTAGHGAENFIKGIQNSCNPVFMEVGSRIGATTMYNYVSAFGLMEKTGIDLPGEGSGYFYSLKSIGPVELATISFGQGFQVTPLQMITAVSAAVNGGYLVTPHVVKEVIDPDGNVTQTFSTEVKRQVISKETSEIMRSLLESVVSGGTGKNAYVKGYRVGGKTGTSEKLNTKDEAGNVEKIVSFVGVAPSNDPQVAVLIMLDTPTNRSATGGIVAAPVVGAIMEDILPYLGITPQYTEQELQNMEVTVPNVTGLTLAQAREQLGYFNLSMRAVGTEGTVVEQVPRAGQVMPKNGKVIVYTADDQKEAPIAVPNVIGKTAEQANQIIVNAGLNIRIQGFDVTSSGVTAAKQTPEAGQMVDPGTVVTVEFLHKIDD